MNDYLLLHVCCGPCAIMPAARFTSENYKVVFWYMNPNIHPLSEYFRRREAASQCAERSKCEIIYDDSSWDIVDWLKQQIEHVAPALRCNWCVEQRIAAARNKAAELDIEYYSTSLLYSIYQPHEHIRKTGEQLNETQGPRFIYRDFRSDWQVGIITAKAWELYRQPYCGCIFSEAERYAKKLSKLIS